jgi:hypothetical protein
MDNDKMKTLLRNDMAFLLCLGKTNSSELYLQVLEMRFLRLYSMKMDETQRGNNLRLQESRLLLESLIFSAQNVSTCEPNDT